MTDDTTNNDPFAKMSADELIAKHRRAVVALDRSTIGTETFGVRYEHLVTVENALRARMTEESSLRDYRRRNRPGRPR